MLSVLVLFVVLLLNALIGVYWPSIIASGLGILGCSLGASWAWSTWKSIYPTEIYENGIVIGWRPKELREQGRDDYVPFKRIDEVYFNGYFGYRLKSEKPKRALQFDHSFDLEAFRRSLEGRVRIERNAHVSPDGQVVWESPDDLKIDGLGFELQWGDRKKEVMFDDLTGLVIRGKFALVTPRDGDEFAIKMNKEMLRRLEKAWIDYQDRFWEDPETEEERWESLEASE